MLGQHGVGTDKEGVVLGNIIFKVLLEIDQAKTEVIENLTPPSNIK